MTVTKQSEKQIEQERQQYLEAAVLPWPCDRRNCGDYTTLAERIAEREGEAARVRALNREMRRQIRSERPLSYWLQWASIIFIYLAAGIAAVIWGLK